jgi:hypothetical protein
VSNALCHATAGLTNLCSVVLIVVANKVVMTTHRFAFPVALTCCHSAVTAVGMAGMAAAGIFEVKRLPWARTAPVAVVYVGFVIFNNLSIQTNTVGFYQISKILITPVVRAQHTHMRMHARTHAHKHTLTRGHHHHCAVLRCLHWHACQRACGRR